MAIIKTKTDGVAPTTESKYKAAELAASARTRFGTAPEVVETALKIAGKSESTVSETKRLVEEFLNKAVK